MTPPPDTLERTWADRWAPETEIHVPPADPQPVARAPLALALLVISTFAVAGLAAVSFLGILDDDETDPAEVAGAIEENDADSDGDGSAAASTTEAPSTTTDATTAESSTTSETPSTTTTTEAPSTTTAEATATTDASATITDLADAEAALALVTGDATRTAVFRGGVVFLQGEVPSQEIADAIAARVAAVVGDENVVVEYTINPDAPVPDSAPLYVDDKILFAVDSSQINREFVPLLQLGTTLMEQNDSVRITVIAHTDSVGDADYNMALSERRAQAVKDFWIESGISPDRIDAIGVGETIPEASNVGASGRAANRRAEFIVQGILG